MPNLTLKEQNAWLEMTIERPSAMNALNSETLDDIAAATSELRRGAHLRGMIVTGAGEKAFVAGADIAELAHLDGAGAFEHARRGQSVFRAIEQCGKPVIAAVNGWALGGGCELALACHIRVLARTARMGLPEVSLGAIPGYGGTQRLARIVGIGRALEMILTGDPVDAETAFRIGLANRVADPAELLAACREIAAKITTRSPRAVALALEATLAGRDMAIDDAFAWEAAQFGLAASTEDWREGTRAFLEKRKPEFRGR